MPGSSTWSTNSSSRGTSETTGYNGMATPIFCMLRTLKGDWPPTGVEWCTHPKRPILWIIWVTKGPAKMVCMPLSAAWSCRAEAITNSMWRETRACMLNSYSNSAKEMLLVQRFLLVRVPISKAMKKRRARNLNAVAEVILRWIRRLQSLKRCQLMCRGALQVDKK